MFFKGNRSNSIFMDTSVSIHAGCEFKQGGTRIQYHSYTPKGSTVIICAFWLCFKDCIKSKFRIVWAEFFIFSFKTRESTINNALVWNIFNHALAYRASTGELKLRNQAPTFSSRPKYSKWFHHLATFLLFSDLTLLLCYQARQWTLERCKILVVVNYLQFWGTKIKLYGVFNSDFLYIRMLINVQTIYYV